MGGDIQLDPNAPLSELQKAQMKFQLALQALDEVREDCLSVDANMHHASLGGVEEQVEMLEELGWKPDPHIFELLKHIKALDFKLGKGKPTRQYRMLDGVQPNEAPSARALGCASEHIRVAQYMEGRKCIEYTYGGIWSNLVIDTSSSMQGDRLKNAKALLASFYLAMTPEERHRCKVFQYASTCTEITMEHVPRLCASGGTDLRKLEPYLRKAGHKERWIVVTDGDLPNMSKFQSEKLVIVSLAVGHPDSRVGLYRNGHVGDHANIERLFRKLLK